MKKLVKLAMLVGFLVSFGRCSGKGELHKEVEKLASMSVEELEKKLKEMSDNPSRDEKEYKALKVERYALFALEAYSPVLKKDISELSEKAKETLVGVKEAIYFTKKILYFENGLEKILVLATSKVDGHLKTFNMATSENKTFKENGLDDFLDSLEMSHQDKKESHSYYYDKFFTPQHKYLNTLK